MAWCISKPGPHKRGSTVYFWTSKTFLPLPLSRVSASHLVENNRTESRYNSPAPNLAHSPAHPPCHRNLTPIPVYPPYHPNLTPIPVHPRYTPT